MDYGLYISQEVEEERRTTDLLGAGDDLGINQTAAHYVRYLPHILAVEAKRPVATTEAEVQLGVWMAALRNRLGWLHGKIRARLDMKDSRQDKAQGGMDTSSEFKALPCLQLEGHVWKLYWCAIGPNDETVSLLRLLNA